MEKKSTSVMNKKLISLFDGIGCFPLAWANINGINHKDLEYYSSEIEDFLCNIIKNNFPKAKQLYDINNIDISSLDSDIITMGTPCTGFSISGDREGLENIESQLFNIGVDVIDNVRPKYFVWENVFGVFSANKGQEMRTILDKFKDIGYDLAWTTLDTQYFNLPQGRRRVYLIGFRDGISHDHDIFDFVERMSDKLKSDVKKSQEVRDNDFNKKSKKPNEHYSFFNRQRSDFFKERALSSTLAKRDYKSYIDLVVKDGSIRRIVPKERLRLQGIPDYWFDCTKNVKTDKQRFQANGMSVNVVEYVFEQIIKNENNKNNNFKMENSENVFRYISESANDIHKNKKGSYLNIPNSGHIRLERDTEGNVLSENAEFLFIKGLPESKPLVEVKHINEILLDNVDEKYHLKEGACNGILNRELKSSIPLPKKMKEVIFYKYPKLKEKYSN